MIRAVSLLIFIWSLLPSCIAQEHRQQVFLRGHLLVDAYMDSPSGQLHYQTIGDPALPALVLIHGSPGDATAWEKLLEDSVLLDHFFVLLIDRPPYGETTLAGGSLSDQSAQLADFIDKHCRPCGLVGHSYGGALALQMGVDYTKQVQVILSIAGTIAAPYQKARWYNYIAKYSPLGWVLPKDFKASNQEMWSLHNDLRALEQQLKTMTVPVYLYQGGKDILVKPQSAAYVDALLPNSKKIYRPDKNHFVIWTDIPDLNTLFMALKEEVNW